MERLTRRFGDKIVQENDSISQWLWIDQVLKRLCDYEDSGMTPEEVWEAKKERQKSKSAPLEVGDTIVQERDKKRKAKVDELNKLKDQT